MLEAARPAKRPRADKAYDADSLQQWLEKEKIKAVIPPSAARRTPYRLDRKSCRSLLSVIASQPTTYQQLLSFPQSSPGVN